MSKKIVLIAITLIILAAGARALLNDSDELNDTDYQFASVSMGNIESIISSTGTLSPLTTVEIGTQVSGTIDSVFVDYNDEIVAGQVLAVLDTVLLKASVIEAEADLSRAEASYEEAEYYYNLNKNLFDKSLISEAELLQYKIAMKTQAASVKSSQAQLERARQNLDYAIIRSPISGTVISKNVESGQTVAASLSTPTLFIVAEDLSRMEILVDVDESDIGMIKPGQNVRFEVQAYDDISFEGTVRQVRLQPTTVSNVVTYTAVVDATNKDNLLLPGMTATIDFIVEEKQDVLLVSNKALRFQPDEKVMQAVFEKKQKEIQAAGNIPANAPPAMDESGNNLQPSTRVADETQNDNSRIPDNASMVWYLDENDELQMAPLKIGMTDGINTEIVMSIDLTAGDQVIIGNSTGDDSENDSSSNSGRDRMSGFPPPPGF